MLTLTASILRQFQARSPENYSSVKSGVWIGNVNRGSPADRFVNLTVGTYSNG